MHLLGCDLKRYRFHRQEWPRACGYFSSSVSEESSAASSLDKYVKAVLGDECTEEKDDTDGTRNPRRNDTPPGSEDFDTGRGLISASPVHMNRVEEYSISPFSTSGEHPVGDWTRHGYDHNHHQLSGFQIFDQRGGWEHVRVALDLSSRHSLISEDTVHRLRISLIMMPPGLPGLIHTRFGSAPFASFAMVQMRTLTGMSAVRANLMSTMLLPVGLDILIGESLFEMLGGLAALPLMTMSPEFLNWTPPDPLIPTLPTIDPSSLLEGGGQFTQEHLDHSEHPVSQPDSNIGPSWPGLCGSTMEFPDNFVQYQLQEHGVL